MPRTPTAIAFFRLLHRLAKGYEWRVENSGSIRCQRPYSCPLAFVAYKAGLGNFMPVGISSPAEVLGMSLGVAGRLADAADDPASRSLHRKRLLKAVGLA